VSAGNRIVALDAILDAATMRNRAEGPGRYRYLPRTLVALTALAQGLAAVAEAITEASAHARSLTPHEVQSVADDAWRAGYARHSWEEHRFREVGPAAGEHVPADREEYLDSLAEGRSS
jgi:hypothetical protein